MQRPDPRVKSVAEDRDVKMPCFFGFMAGSGDIFVPLFIVMTFLWFR